MNLLSPPNESHSLILICLLGICVSEGESPIDLKPDAVAIWDFEEGSGKLLKDSSGSGHHGHIVEATWVSGEFGSALRFDGKGHYVRVPDAPVLRLQPPYTLGVWFQTTSAENNGVYLLSRGSQYSYGLYLYDDSLALDHYVRGTDEKIYNKGCEAKNVPDGTWHHVVGTCEQGKMKFFLDGELRSERELPANLRIKHLVRPSPGGDVFLGCWWGAGHLKGMMGKAYILKRALKNEEVKKLHDQERKRFSGILDIQKVTQKPKIDGKLDDACWQGQTSLTNFTLNNYEAALAKKQTHAKLCYDDQNLYIGVRCDEPNVAGISADEKKRDGQIWLNDCIEMFIGPRDETYYQLIINAANTQCDLKVSYKIGKDGFVVGGFGVFKNDFSWNCAGLRSATSLGKDHWLLELAIPFSSLGGAPKPGGKWRFNIAREEKQLKELSTFSPLFGDFHQPEAYSWFTFQKDSAQLARAPKKFKARDMTPSLAEANAAARKEKAPAVFVNNYLERGYPTSLPKPGQKDGAIEIFAASGEYEPATFSVRAGDKAVKSVSAELAGDLKSESGAVIPKKQVEIRVVEIWKRWLTSRKFIHTERFLLKQNRVDIPSHTTQRFWATVHVPAEAKAGTYKTNIVIRTGDAVLRNLPYRLEVLPFKLQPTDDMAYFMYLPNWGIPKKLHTQEYLRKVFEDMKAHGMTTSTLYLFPWGNIDGKRQFTFDAPGEHGQFAIRPALAALKESGLQQADIPAIWVGADLVGPSDWKKVLDEARKMNWPELLLYLQDEPGNEERIANAKRLFKRWEDFKVQYPEYQTIKTTTAMGTAGIKALGERYDIWIADAGTAGKDKLPRTAKSMGKKLWTYDCSTAQIDAETSRYYYGYWSWIAGVKGCANWAYADWQNTAGILDWDYIGKNLDKMELPYCFVYPSPDGPVPSIAWEAIREGIDDRRYISTLTKLIEKAKAAGHQTSGKEAKEFLQKLRDRLNPEAYSTATRAGEATGRRLGALYDRPSPEASLSKVDYNTNRYRIAQQIILLMKLTAK